MLDNSSSLLGYIYEYEIGVNYKAGQLIIYDDRAFQAVVDFMSSDGGTDSLLNMKEFDVPTVSGDIVQVGPFDATNGYIFGNNTITLEAPSGYSVVGYRMFGVGAANFPDGGQTGSSIRHWMYCRRVTNAQ